MKFDSNNEHHLYPVGIEDGYYGSYKYDKDSKETYFKREGRAVYIEKIEKKLETDEVILTIKYEYNGEDIYKSITRDYLRKQQIQELVQYGVDVFNYNSDVLIKVLSNQEKSRKINIVHQDIGWDTYKGNPIFKGYSAVGIDSKYNGDLAIKPKGTYNKWKSMIEEEVIGQIPLELALTIGLSSVTVGFIGDKIQSGNLITHIYGDSTTGKTTAAELAVSTGGCTRLQNNGLMLNFNSTHNAIMGTLRGNKGFAMVLDEASMGQKDFTKFIYTIESGREKSRMNKDLSLRESSTWLTSTVSTGEFSLIHRSKKNTGLKVRLQEYGNITWTKNASNAENIKKVISNNYGHANNLLAKYMIEVGREAVIQTWEKWRNICQEQALKKDEFVPRISIKQAVIMTTAEIANKALGLHLDLDSILQFILKNEAECSSSRDIAQNAYDHLIEAVNLYTDKFGNQHTAINNTNIDPQHEVWGKIHHLENGITLTNGESCRKELVISPKIFGRIMTEGGFEDPNIILRKWKERGWLNAEKDRLSRTRKISQMAQAMKVYVIYMFEVEADEEGRRPRERPNIRLNI